jgi:ribosomal protein L25 (general stress protein Ctc)
MTFEAIIYGENMNEKVKIELTSHVYFYIFAKELF